MVLSKKITSCIWDKCTKQIVDGYVYVKMDDIIKLHIEKDDSLEHWEKEWEEKQKSNTKITMNQIASYLNDRGWIFERNPDTGDIWRRKSGDIHNRKKIN